jgi:hypothetical protein
MRLRCIRRVPVSVDRVVDLAAYKRPDRTPYDLVVGEEYVAMGLGFWDAKVWIEVATAGDFLISVPLDEFEIVSGTPSIHWKLEASGDGYVRLWPSSFYQPAYHSDLADRVPAVIDDFERVRKMLEGEDREMARPVRLEQ